MKIHRKHIGKTIVVHNLERDISQWRSVDRNSTGQYSWLCVMIRNDSPEIRAISRNTS